MTRVLHWIFAAAMALSWTGCAATEKDAVHRDKCSKAEVTKCHSQKEKRGCDKPCTAEEKAACSKPCPEKHKTADESK